MTVTLLDGGMGQELIHRAGDRPTPLWSTQVMMDRPGLVQEIHSDYFAAGADIATTNSYAIHHDRLIPDGLDHLFVPLMQSALAEAAAARKAHGGQGRIAGSVGPLIASYRPDLHPEPAKSIPLFAEILALLAPEVDLILFETVASLMHAETALAAAAQSAGGKPVWVSVTLDDADGTRLRSGERVADLLPLLKKGGAAAVLANCSIPEAMPAALDVFATGDLPFGAYANGFTKIADGFLEDRPTVDALSARSDLGPMIYADHVMGWIAQGASIVGGCCEVGPAHIAEIARRLRAAGLHG